MIVGAICFLAAVGYTWQAFQIPLGTLAKPGAGLFPRIVGFAAIVISIIVIVEAIVVVRDPEDEREFELPHGKELRHVIVFFGATVLFAVLLPILGQYLAGTLYAYGLFMYLGKRRPINWIKSAVYAVILGVGVPWIFVHFLQVSLPDGVVLPGLFPGLY